MLEESQFSLDKEIYRPKEIADMIGVSIMTIHNSMRDGRLDYYTLPHSKHRRVTREALIKYLEDSSLLDSRKVKHDIVYTYVEGTDEQSRNEREQQLRYVESEAIKKNPRNVLYYSDSGQCPLYERESFNHILDYAMSNRVNRIFVDDVSKRLSGLDKTFADKILRRNGVTVVDLSKNET